ncbi:hypothetical protein QWY84_15985 [Aquisalimonas lutea]|uniref:hypothetical protein n=1 Tax=Aquisalimonas lutea TaxID=1327750 RepID=UPI0025B2BB80|nr:hypothetical protein [Aquisalimonas lutea]MDN3519115.1 hypothetical protein [Aquisalimonas lutea]
MRREQKKTEEPFGGPMEQGKQLAVLGVGVAMLLLAWFAPQFMYEAFVQDYYQPLANSGPVVRVNYANFAAAGLVWVGIGAPLLTGYVVLLHYIRIGDSVKRTVSKWLSVWIWGGVVLVGVVPIVAGITAESYVRAQNGYEYCGRLFELGVGRFERVYISDPRLCVSPYVLDEALERYGYAQVE